MNPPGTNMEDPKLQETPGTNMEDPEIKAVPGIDMGQVKDYKLNGIPLEIKEYIFNPGSGLIQQSIWDSIYFSEGTSHLRPEAGYLKGKKHGLKRKEGPARAKNTGNPQGQWGSMDDLNYAGEKAGTLNPGEGTWFDLPEGSSSVVHMPDGTTVDATRIWVKNNGTGTFHGYPAP